MDGTLTNLEARVTLPSDLEIRVERAFAAPIQLVWEAWTQCRHLQQWLLGPPGWTMPECEVDLRPGGTWRYLWRNDATGEEFFMHGEYREVAPPKRAVHTEMFGDGPAVVNTLEMFEANGLTTSVITTLCVSQEARDAMLATGMTDGMDASYTRLDEYLAALGRQA